MDNKETIANTPSNPDAKVESIKKIKKVNDSYRCYDTYHFDSLRFISNSLAIRSMCPIYLVGSFVTDGLEGLDIDIIMVASKDRIMRMFHDTNWNDRWFRYYKKQKEFYEKHMHDVDIDFKVQSEETFNAHVGLRIKLDDVIHYEEKKK